MSITTLGRNVVINNPKSGLSFVLVKSSTIDRVWRFLFSSFSIQRRQFPQESTSVRILLWQYHSKGAVPSSESISQNFFSWIFNLVSFPCEESAHRGCLPPDLHHYSISLTTGTIFIFEHHSINHEWSWKVSQNISTYITSSANIFSCRNDNQVTEYDKYQYFHSRSRKAQGSVSSEVHRPVSAQENRAGKRGRQIVIEFERNTGRVKERRVI